MDVRGGLAALQDEATELVGVRPAARKAGCPLSSWMSGIPSLRAWRRGKSRFCRGLAAWGWRQLGPTGVCGPLVGINRLDPAEGW